MICHKNNMLHTDSIELKFWGPLKLSLNSKFLKESSMCLDNLLNKQKKAHIKRFILNKLENKRKR